MLAVRIDKELENKLAALARQKRRSKSDLVREALRRYLDEDAWLRECVRQSENATSATYDDPVDGLLDEAVDAVTPWT